MGDAGDKTLADVGGEPLIARTVSVFEQCDAVTAIALVVSERNLDAIAALREERVWRKTLPPLVGGVRRQDSVRAGLDALPAECDWVLVHDGARPFVTPRMIEEGLAAAADTGAAIAVVPAFDTVKRVGEGGRVVETLDRSELAMVQTPQVFRRDVLERAHAEVAADVTDDAAMVERTGVEVRTFDGARSNIKVTTPEDLVIADALNREEFKQKFDRPIYYQGFMHDIEEVAISDIYVDHSMEMRVLRIGIEQIATGLQRITPGELSKTHYAQLLLAIRGFHSLTAAALLLERSYYSQSLALVRMAMESHLVGRYITNSPEVRDMLLDGKKIKWIGRLSFASMARTLPEGEQWLKRYGPLSENAHPRNPSMNMLVRENKIVLYTQYEREDHEIASALTYSILGEIERHIGFIETIAGEFGLGTSEGAFAVIGEIRAMRQAIEDKQPELLGAMIEDEE